MMFFSIISIFTTALLIVLCSAINNKFESKTQNVIQVRKSSTNSSYQELADLKYTTVSEGLLGITADPILPEWGGNCTKKHWNKCSNLTRWVTSHVKDRKRPELGYKYYEIDCKIQPVMCLKNGWTVTRCQLLCMRCNREFLSKYDKYVAKESAC